MNDASFFLSFYPLVVLLGAAAIVAIRYGAQRLDKLTVASVQRMFNDFKSASACRPSITRIVASVQP